MVDLQRKRAVSDMERRKKEEQEQVIVSPGLSPTGQQAQISRADFNNFQRQKQQEQIQKQNITQEIAAKLLSPSPIEQQQQAMPTPQTTTKINPWLNIPETVKTPQAEQGIIPTTQELLKRASPEIAADTTAKVAALAGGGAVAGSIAGGVGALPGAAVGAVGGVGWSISNAYSTLKQEASKDVSISYKDFTSAKTNIKTIIRAAKTDPTGAYETYQAQWKGIEQAERKFKAYSEKDWLFKAKTELEAIESFREMKPIYDQLLLKAIGGEDINLPEEIA